MPTPTENLEAIRNALAIAGRSDTELLGAYAVVLDELKARGLCRTKNNPVADYAEWLVSSRLGLVLRDNSSTGFDAVGPEGTRYQIKGRRVTPSNPSVQLGAIRSMSLKQFDFLVGVIFEADFSVRYAAMVPHQVIAERSGFRAHTNAHVFHLRTSVFALPEVQDLTTRLR
jgi:hypothetical protein